MKKYKKDIIIVLGLCIAALVFYLFFYILHNKDAKYVQVYREDTLIKTYPLKEDGQYDIKMKNNLNRIVIQKGSVYIKEANCPDKLCVKQGSISKVDESIICLPHKIVIRISSKEGVLNE